MNPKLPPDLQQTPTSKKFPLWLVIAILAVLIIGGVAVAFFYKTPRGITPTENNTVTKIPTPSVSLNPTPEPTQVPYQEATIKQFTIKTGIDVKGPFQDLPYGLITANGHYLLYVYETKKLVYDGKEIYTGENFGGMTLSHNGLHYAYVIRNGNTKDFYANTSNDLYIDGRKITSAQNLGAPAITDDGQHYFYITSNSGGMIGGVLFKDDIEIFRHSSGILGFWISGDGLKYFASLRNIDSSGNFVESLIMDGKEIYKGHELKDKVFSNDGKHYAYVTSDFETRIQTLIVDGVVKRTSGALNLSQITNSGYYAVWDSVNKKVFISDKEIPVKGDLIRISINDNASHVLIYDNGWLLDGKSVQFQNIKPEYVIGDYEIVDNTVFVYGLIK